MKFIITDKKDIEIIYYYDCDTEFGKMLICTTDKGICYIGFTSSDEIESIHKIFPQASFVKQTDKAKQLNAKEILSEKNYDTLVLHLAGTPFQLKVWKELANIPRGKTSTYKEITEKLFNNKAYRAVGSAVGDNPISYILPCHRVLNTNHAIGNYLWGSDLKKKLLVFEKAI